MKKLLGAAVLAIGLSTSAHASVIFADNFNSNVSDQTPGTPAGWTIITGSVDVIGGPGTGYNWYPGNGAYIDLDGSTGAGGQNTLLMTTASFLFTSGKYNVKFDYGINHNDGGDSDTITFGAYVPLTNSYFDLLTVDANALNHSASIFSHAFQNFFAVGNPTAQLYFRGTSVGHSDQSGGLIDNLVVSSVPLPGAALLLVSGLLGLGGASRLRRKQKA